MFANGTDSMAPPPAVHEERGGGTKLVEFWQILVSRRRVTFTCLAAVVVTTMVLTLFATPQYQATATLQIELLAPDVLAFKDVVSAESTYEGYWNFYHTQHKLLRSRSVLLLAVENIDLTRRPEFLGRKRSPMGRLYRSVKSAISKEATEDPVAEALEFLLEDLTIRPVRDSQLVEVSFTHSRPELARDVANAVTDAYLEFNFRSRYGTTAVAKEFLTTEVVRVQGDITELEGKLQDYSTSKDILALSDGTSDISEQALSDLSRRYMDARGRLAVAESRFDSLRECPPDALPEVLHSALIASLKEQHAAVERRYSQMAERFKPDWPPLMQVREEMNKARERLDLETENIARQVRGVAGVDHERARTETAKLEKQLEAQKVEVKRTQRDAIKYASLKAEIETKRGVLRDLVARQSETTSSERLKNTRTTSNIRVVDPAELPKRPVRPSKALNLFVSILMGITLGVGMAFLLEHLDNTIKSGHDIERYVGLPLLGFVPLFQPLRVLDEDGERPEPTREQVDLASHLDPRSAFAEAFKSLRTSLLLASPDHPPRHLVITSCQPRDGKSTVSLNLSIVLTQLGRRVLLVDADLRLPRLHKVLDLPNGVGLSSYLSGNCAPEEIIQDTTVPKLHAVPSGPIPPNPSELLGSPRLGAFVDWLCQDQAFDYLVFDSSPLLSVSDPFILASRLDATIIVVRAGSTAREALVGGMARLRQSRARIIGAVLNGVTERSEDYYYGRYKYHYGEQEPAEVAGSPGALSRHGHRTGQV